MNADLTSKYTSSRLMLLLTALLSGPGYCQSAVQALPDPIPETIQKGDITVVAEPFVHVPQTIDSGNHEYRLGQATVHVSNPG
ncbi:MAG: hypothetical protein OXE78_14505 [Gammaproteobacteria bacterium]|nr:hypothetical protein [Gammaproteobacteria bacterium]